MDKLKLGALGERLKSGGAQMGRAVSGKMKEILQGPTQESKMVDEATSENLEDPNWGLNLRICGLLNSEEFSGPEVLKAIKKKLSGNVVMSQKLALDLLETCAMNCEKVFSEIASEKVLDEMVKMIEHPRTAHGNRKRAMELIKAWSQSEDLTYLPVFNQTYLSLVERGATAQQDDEDTMFSYLEPNDDQHRLIPGDNYPIPDVGFQSITGNTISYHDGNLSAEDKKEFLVITRNGVELLSSMLYETQLNPLKDDLTMSMFEKCKETQPVIQRIIQTTSDDEGVLFEALNLNDELQNVLSKYEEMAAAARSEVQEPENFDTGPNTSTDQVQAVNEAKIKISKGEDVELGGAMKSLQIGESKEIGSVSRIRPNGESSEIGSRDSKKTA